ncbi:aminopeptidase [Aequitasia blattaphilus]|uniref:Aminopeptidase n=1 Tax=Aequitasia blattaphilus TaxID=2949332 RepID=A0ABT1EAJ4_9FIRM|nr:aminopeptidase [Aequitasia blattaphilus]MCP1102639.1 aminopeptidase [Aequitasia blattaphilus]MCR8615279.1 aminopeptidase [Aequitasia blattaphilus]
MYEERYRIAKERLLEIKEHSETREQYKEYFSKLCSFLLKLDEICVLVIKNQYKNLSQEAKVADNDMLYRDLLKENYEKCYGNPSYSKACFGEELQKAMTFLYHEVRRGISCAFHGKNEELLIRMELFLEIYSLFSWHEEDYEKLKDILYWYEKDYCEIFVRERVENQLLPDKGKAMEIVEGVASGELEALYLYGEYIGENERKVAEFLQQQDEEVISRMAESYVEGFRKGFELGRKDLSIKDRVNIRYPIGFERVVSRAVDKFKKMGLKSILLYSGSRTNPQYDFDHKEDGALVMDRAYKNRELEVLEGSYGALKEEARLLAGPAVIETFGEEPFEPSQKESAIRYTKEQEMLKIEYDMKARQVVNRFVPGEERSFTIVAYPIPEIGKDFQEIFSEIIKINTLDYDVYLELQQRIIDVLDLGDYVHVLGCGENQTDIKIKLYELENEEQTSFENCVADVNIPVGEVFTSPVLEGTQGKLHVKKAYLNGLLFKELILSFEDGKVVDYSCENFETKEDNQKFIESNLFHYKEHLPMGEFAIGTNTLAYKMARKYEIEDKLPVLIAEKTGTHFAIGDTCYSWSEDVRVFNPNGKEIVAKENSISKNRKDDVKNAYYNLHTDITIPYDELGGIKVYKKNQESVDIFREGEFVLPNMEILNTPLKK